jgi:hypothetical protein
MNEATQITEIASARLVGEGAVMTVWNSPPEAFLVGRAQCLDDRRFFFFAANGDGAADAHVVEFDASQSDQDAVRFFLNRKLVGLLTSVEHADVTDREDYQVGWQIWQAVAPMKQSLIDRLVNDLDPE